MTNNSNWVSSVSSKLCEERKNLTEQRPTNHQQLEQQISQIQIRQDLEDLIAGAKLGLKAYQKPSDGIPFTDLNADLQKLILQQTQTLPEDNNVKAFGRVIYNEVSNKLQFYAYTDTELNNLLGEVQLPTYVNETDPTVPTCVKNITPDDIRKWNSNNGSSGEGVEVTFKNGNLIFS